MKLLFIHQTRAHVSANILLPFMFFCYRKKALHPLPAEGHPAVRSMKLLAKIPKDAEATVVLVGKLHTTQNAMWVTLIVH